MVVSTRSSTVSQRNLRPAFFCSAPGRRCASVSTWKPLQIPTTGPPAAANSVTALHHRREARERARAQVVAVREPAGHDDRVDAVDRSRRRASSSSASRAELLDRPHRRRARSSCPGNSTTPTRVVTTRLQAEIVDLVRLDHRVGEQPLAHLLDLRARARRRRARRRRAGSSCRCAPARRSCSRAPAARARRSRRPDRRSRAGA